MRLRAWTALHQVALLLLQFTGMVSTSRAAFRLLTTLSCGYHHSRPVCTRVRHVHPWLAAQLSQDNALHESSGPSSLAELPDFRGPSRLLKDAYKKSKELTPNYKIGNQKKRITKFATQRIDAYASSISVAMRDQLKAYRDVMRRLPPFQHELAELTFASIEREGGHSLRTVEHDFDQLRRSVVRVGKEAAAEASKAANKQEAEELMEKGLALVEETFEEEQEALMRLIDTSQRLRRLPRPVDDEPVLVLVGMPNVGKSSLVDATSTGNPEINDYPFTTRRLKMGHVIGRAGRYQVMDTPGVLSRSEEDRNPMEGLTLAAVEHLPSAVVFVMDLSGTSGEQSAPLLQLGVRDLIRQRYPDRPWLDVRSKADLPLAEEVPEAAVPQGTLNVSVIEDIGVEELKQRLAMLVGGDVEAFS